MSFKKTNIITGWIVCAIACTVYIMTREASCSFWDCGEFIPCAYKLQISHAPGAPLFIILGRIFIILFGGGWNATVADPHAAVQVNLLSSVCSGLTILFLFWTITHLAKRLLLKKNEEPDLEKKIVILGAGAVGALCLAFSDSFWFSSVEGIVWGVSPVFIAMAFWAILKWEEQADDPRSDRWIVLMAYILGLSIGVHLLSLLAIPAVVMTYYFRKFKFSRKGLIIAFLIGCVLTVIVQVLIIQDFIKVMGWFEILFVNSLGLPFNSGCFFFIIALLALIMISIRWAARNGKHHLQVALYSLTFLLLGYSSYAEVLIRANAGTAVNMQNVDSPIELVAYLDRSQYGEWPLLRGAYFDAQPSGQDETGNIYYKNDSTGRYEVVGKKYTLTYNDDDMHWLDRVWDSDNSQGHADFYKSWLHLDNGEEPTLGDNIKWLFQYQFQWMYWRYFMWNFSGRQNDLQGLGGPRDGNWISGIKPLDNLLLGDQSKLPDSLKNNAAHTTLFLLPFLFGIGGLIFQATRHKTDFVVTFLLFFMTGIAIILYLNQAGPQPRERDYSYTGSFYAFSIWVGLGVLFAHDLLKKARLKGLTAAGLTTVVGLAAVPLLMACQEWKAHDRSAKTLARDAASDYLNSCAPDAILFTGGDNDTYPLWYDQEVENIRPDVRVIVTSLLGTDWMINQLRDKINDSPPIPMSWSPDKYLGDARNDVPFYDSGKVPKGAYADLNDLMRFIGDDRNQIQTGSGAMISYFPTQNFSLPVDKAAVLANGTVEPKDSASIVPTIQFTYPSKNLFKNELMELNIIAANAWHRPVYFTQPYDLGINNYLEDDGMAYRLVPLQPLAGGIPHINVDIMYKNLMEKFKFGGAQKKNVYFDENSRRILLQIRRGFSNLGQELASMGKKDSAKKVLDYGYKMLDPTSFPYAMVSDRNMHDVTSYQYAYAYYQVGDTIKAGLISDAVIKDCRQQVAYYKSLSPEEEATFNSEEQYAQQLISALQSMKAQYTHSAPANQELPGMPMQTAPPTGKPAPAANKPAADTPKKR